MRLLEQFLPGGGEFRVRPPDFVESRHSLFLQIWGEEGYWQVVDLEFRQLLQAAEHRTTLKRIFAKRPDWRSHDSAIRSQLGNMRKAGLLGAQRKPGPPAQIENLTINLATACNLNCRTCYVVQESRTAARLNVDQLLRFLQALRPCFSSNVTFSLLGGEPFLHFDAVLATGLWAKRHGHSCNVSTNGTICSERILEGLAEADLKVQVSLDGATAEMNDAIRGVGTFKKATATARALARRRIPTTLCMVCCQENCGEIPRYFRLAQELGAEQVRFIPLKKLGNGSDSTLAPAPQLQIVQAICRELDSSPSFRSMCRSDLYSIIRSMLRESSRRPSCGSGTQTLLLQADGSIYPCINTTIASLRLGHISGPIAPALARGAEFGEKLAVDSPLHPCHGCHVKRWCLAGCPGETIQQEGALSRKHWNCQDLKQTIAFVMWRLSKEGPVIQQTIPRTSI